MYYLKSMMQLLVLTFSLCYFSSCDKQDDTSCEVAMKFQTYEGFEDCGLLLSVNLEDEWRTLIPSNLEDFDITPTEGLEVCGSFVNETSQAQCGIGEVVNLTSLTLR